MPNPAAGSDSITYRQPVLDSAMTIHDTDAWIIVQTYIRIGTALISIVIAFGADLQVLREYSKLVILSNEAIDLYRIYTNASTGCLKWQPHLL
jgi:hypothetical protein